ncbi:hypothetical protein H7313_01145 [Gordonibacter massiliensis]|uniref:Uncharacterized protein n=2 Tax=Gordonibacter massiliensis (ex Traore et al. 2017) TaxID=1841863 RepID=A0A842JG18_9ACTN|nr:hypothetical protein [Gordonibacter massiliensis (ex Traore et al. 2017)]
MKMETTYTGFYARFNTLSKKDAAVLLGADNLVGDVFDIEFVTDDTRSIAWMKNRFGKLVGFFDPETTRRLRVLHARDWNLKAILSFVAYTDNPEPGEYWGEAALLCYAPEHEQIFTTFLQNTAARLTNGVRPEVDLGEQAIKQILDSNGTWAPTKTVPLPAKKNGTVIMKSHRKASEKLIEQGRKGNKGCYVVSWLFILAVVALGIFGLKSCGVF